MPEYVYIYIIYVYVYIVSVGGGDLLLSLLWGFAKMVDPRNHAFQCYDGLIWTIWIDLGVLPF